MTTAVSTQAAPTAIKANIESGGVLHALVPKNLDEAFRLATALAGSGDMVPKAFQNQPQATMAAIIRGMEVGLHPMQALSSIAVINGRAVIWGDALPALMQRAGHHIDVEFEGTGDALVAVATLTRGDTGKTIIRRFGMADAKRAGLAGKAGPWTQYPSRMCAHRARSWAARDGAADALMGMEVAAMEETQGPNGARDVTPSQPTPRRGGIVYADAENVDDILEGDAPGPRPDDAALEAAHAAAMEAAQANAAEHDA